MHGATIKINNMIFTQLNKIKKVLSAYYDKRFISGNGITK